MIRKRCRRVQLATEKAKPGTAATVPGFYQRKVRLGAWPGRAMIPLARPLEMKGPDHEGRGKCVVLDSTNTPAQGGKAGNAASRSPRQVYPAVSSDGRAGRCRLFVRWLDRKSCTDLRSLT